MMRSISIDVETFSTEDVKLGVHKYCTRVELLLFAYSIDRGPVHVVDIAQGEQLPDEVADALFDKNFIKKAWNAAFEIEVLESYLGVPMKLSQWQCTMVKSARCGYPLSLDKAAKAIGLPIEKDTAGKALIKLFSVPRKPTKNNPATRIYPADNPEKWAQYIEYNRRDVEVEMAIDDFLSQYPAQPEFEQKMYVLDRQINKRGIELDIPFIEKAVELDAEYKERLIEQAKELTGLDNPNSVAQLKSWIGINTGVTPKSLTNESLKAMLEGLEIPTVKFITYPKGSSGYEEIASQDNLGWHQPEYIFPDTLQEEVDAGLDVVPLTDDVLKMLHLRKELSNTSVRKYTAMLASNVGGRIYDTIQFNGAGRTGRNAGRLIQPQNLPRVYMEDETLDLARRCVKAGNLEMLELMFGSVSSALSQLIRTALIAKEGHILKVVDLSAIEARVLAWLAGEEHVLQVFRTHGKIYEATAAMMFKVPFESVTKGSIMRQRGKVASLACIAEGSLVLSDRRGVVPIEDLSVDEKVYDGVDFVNHSGVIFQGVQNVIWYEGLTATPDHLVYPLNDTWMPLEQAASEKQKLIRLPFLSSTSVDFRTQSRVYDILNCGPRNQFMANGIIVHNCGYQGGANAISTMDIDKSIPDEDKPGLVRAWREAHPNIVRFWYKTQDCAIKAIKNPGEKVPLTKGAYFVVTGGALLFYLPSGRYLMYPKVGLEEGQYGPKIIFWGLDQTTGQWRKQDTYSGKLVENMVQGAARDVLMQGMYNMVRKGYNLVTNVHDETVAETAIGFGSIEEIEQLMCDMPAWADGLPLGAEGFESEYYKK